MHRRPELRRRGQGRAVDRVRPDTRPAAEAVRALRARPPRPRATPGTITRERQYSCPRLTAWRSPRRWSDRSSPWPTEHPVPRLRGAGLAARRLRAGERHRSVHRGDGRLGGRRPGDCGGHRVLRGKPWCCGKGGGRGVRRLPLPQLAGQARRPRSSRSSSGNAACGRGWTSASCRPGVRWQPELEEIIARHPGRGGDRRRRRLVPGRRRRLDAFIRQSVDQGRCAIVPVLLPDVNTADLSVFLERLDLGGPRVTGTGPDRPARVGRHRPATEPLTACRRSGVRGRIGRLAVLAPPRRRSRRIWRYDRCWPAEVRAAM